MMMTSCIDEKEIGKASTKWFPVVSGSTEVTMLIYSLEIITKIGKNFPIIFLSLASLNILLAANDFLTNSIEFGILNSLFAVNGFIFLVQTHHNNRVQSHISNHHKMDSRNFLEIKEVS